MTSSENLLTRQIMLRTEKLLELKAQYPNMNSETFFLNLIAGLQIHLETLSKSKFEKSLLNSEDL